MNKFTKISILVVTCLGIGYLSSIVTKSSVDTWYPTTIKPSFNPPNWAFPIAWTTLFVFMGIAGGLVWDKIKIKPDEVKKALVFFAIQLALNALWSFLFFGLRNPMLAMIEIVLLWLMIYETFVKFNRIDKISGYLFVPYLLWVSFAAVLNVSIWWLNQ
jgi:benzodiazapine receptor